MVIINKSIKEITAYKPGKPIEEVKRELGLKEVVKLASNENPLGPSPYAVLAIKKAVNKINRYPEGSCFYLRKGLTKKLGVASGNLIFGNGSDEIIDIIVKTFSAPGDEVLTSDTTFLEYKIIAEQNNRSAKCVPLKDFRYDLAKIRDSISRRTKIIFIANPNNPTGTYVSRQEVGDFLKGVPCDIVVVFDEAYFEFVDKRDFPLTLNYLKERNKNVIILRTFSKIYGLAGLRIGYGIANEDFIRYMEGARQPFNVNYLAQEAALAGLKDAAFIAKTKEIVSEGKKYLYSELDRLGLTYIPSVTNFILIDLKQDGLAIFNKLLKRGVIVRDMRQYGLNNFIRVTIGTKRENDIFIMVLKKIL